MSSPLDRAPGPDDPSPYAPKWAREGGQRRETAPATPDRYFPTGFEDDERPEPLDEQTAAEPFRLPRSLDPAFVPEPSDGPRSRNVWAIAGVGVLAISAAALVAWLVVGGSPRSSQTAQEQKSPNSFLSRFAEAEPSARSGPQVPHLVVATAPARSVEDALALGLALDAPTKGASVALAGLPAGTTLSRGQASGANGWQLSAAELDSAMIRPPRGFAGSMDIMAELRLSDGTVVERRPLHFDRVPAAQPPRQAALRQLDADEIATLNRRGEGFIATGDLAAARLMLQRAAEAGDARAALALAGTYDPNVLEQLGVRGFAPDIALAQAWYEKAKDFGSAEAPGRLERLASRDH
jgi:TPR repeat protein